MLLLSGLDQRACVKPQLPQVPGKECVKKWCHCCVINGSIKARDFLKLLLDSYISLYGNIHDQSSPFLGFPAVIFTVPSPVELLYMTSPGPGSSPIASSVSEPVHTHRGAPRLLSCRVGWI